MTPSLLSPDHTDRSRHANLFDRSSHRILWQPFLLNAEILTAAGIKRHSFFVGHPAVRNLAWRDARSMLRSLTEAARVPNGNLEVTRNGQTPDLHAPLDNNLD